MTTLQINSEDVRDLPPSAKLVYLIVQETGPCTQAEIHERSLLPRRTVRGALGQLVDEDLVESEVLLRDTRKRLYDVS